MLREHLDEELRDLADATRELASTKIAPMVDKAERVGNLRSRDPRGPRVDRPVRAHRSGGLAAASIATSAIRWSCSRSWLASTPAPAPT